jgi:hypothetical protein
MSPLQDSWRSEVDTRMEDYSMNFFRLVYLEGYQCASLAAIRYATNMIAPRIILQPFSFVPQNAIDMELCLRIGIGKPTLTGYCRQTEGVRRALRFD